MTRPLLTRGELLDVLNRRLGPSWADTLARFSGLCKRRIQRWRGPGKDPGEPLGGEGLRDVIADALDAAGRAMADAADAIRKGPDGRAGSARAMPAPTAPNSDRDFDQGGAP